MHLLFIYIDKIAEILQNQINYVHYSIIIFLNYSYGKNNINITTIISSNQSIHHEN